MTVVLIILVVLLIVGIIILNKEPSTKEKTREEFLEELTHFLEGKLEPLEGQDNAFRIIFQFEGVDFMFEDVEAAGFGGTNYKGYLKTKTGRNLDLNFTEVHGKVKIKSDILIASEIKDEPLRKDLKVSLPKALQGLKVFTNDPETLNKLFEDQKFVRVLSKFKNEDSRRHPFVSLKIEQGEVILEFHTNALFRPSYVQLHNDVPSIENQLNQLLVVVKTLNKQEFL